MNKIIIPIIIIGSLILLGIGFFLGFSFQTPQVAPEQEETPQEEAPQILESISSKIISSITAMGKVTKISGDTITLTQGTENLSIRVKKGAKVSSFVTPTPVEQGETGAIEQKTVSFEDIKVGDSLNIGLEILSDGTVEGLFVIIFPPLAGAR